MERKTSQKFANVDEYFADLSEKEQAALSGIRNLIREIVPQAEEVISYSMPAFKYHGLLVWYAAAKNHYSLFPKALPPVFSERLKDFDTSKGTIRFSYNKPLPKELISDIVKFRLHENLKKLTNKQTKPAN